MKKLVIPFVILVILAAGGYALVAKKNNKTPDAAPAKTTNSSSKATTPSKTPTLTPEQEAKALTNITISGSAFIPSGSITVKKGTTVSWTNKDSIAHTVTETDGKTGPKSGNINKDETYSFTYTTTGKFAYVCSIHSNMTATITVTE